jgi:hypothetical protein
VEAQLEANDRELERVCANFVSTTARLHGGASLYELKGLGTEAGDIDWEFVLAEPVKSETAMGTLRVWLEKRLTDALAGRPVTPHVEYVLRRLLIERISAEEAVLDFNTYLDAEAERVVEGVQKILVFETPASVL